MTSISSPRLCSKRIDFFRPDGSLMDLAHPEACEIDFNEVAFGLAKINRFTGTYPGVGYSDAQHCVMGAQALLREGEDELTAALFLLHDAHEYKLGDDSRPKQDLVAAMLDDFSPKAAEAYRSVVASAKAGWDNAIYAAAGLPAPSAWTKKQAHAVERMDVRMAAAEAESLFGAAARKKYPLSKFPAPLTIGAITPWAPAKAELAFLEYFDRLIGIQQRMNAANNNLMHRKIVSGR